MNLGSGAPTGEIRGPSHVYYALSYRITAGGEVRMSYNNNLGGGFVGQNDIAAAPVSGTVFGAAGLVEGNYSNAFDGSGMTGLGVDLTVFNPSGSVLAGGPRPSKSGPKSPARA